MNAALPEEIFSFCPRCGQHTFAPRRPGLLVCSSCALHFHVNAAAAVAAVIFNRHGQLLLLERLHEPARGLLDLPGGFVDHMETAEEALRREVMEETGLTLARVAFLCSFPNRYDYRGIRYHTLDLFFTCTPQEGSVPHPADETAAVTWRALDTLRPAELAFESVRRVITFLNA
ncbi:MAG: NUDIX domain-containing protein [bacterium]|nr:NUDIX domain-containing protein [bacterium]